MERIWVKFKLRYYFLAFPAVHTSGNACKLLASASTVSALFIESRRTCFCLLIGQCPSFSLIALLTKNYFEAMCLSQVIGLGPGAPAKLLARSTRLRSTIAQKTLLRVVGAASAESVP